MNTHDDLSSALAKLVNDSPDFRRLLEIDPRVSDFIGLCIQQASIGDRALFTLQEKLGCDYVIDKIAEHVADTWKAEYPDASQEVN